MFALNKGHISNQGCWWGDHHAIPVSKQTVRKQKKISIRQLKSGKKTSKSLKISLTEEICKAKSKRSVAQLIKSPSQTQIKKSSSAINNLKQKHFQTNLTISSPQFYQNNRKLDIQNPEITNKIYHHCYVPQSFVMFPHSPTQINHRITSSFDFSKKLCLSESQKYQLHRFKPLELTKAQSSQVPTSSEYSLESPLRKPNLQATTHSSPANYNPHSSDTRSPQQEQVGMTNQDLKEIQRMLFSKNHQEENMVSLPNSFCQIKKDSNKKGLNHLAVKELAPKMTESDYGQQQSDRDSDQFSDIVEELCPQTPLGTVSPLELEESQKVNFTFYNKQWLTNF